MHIDHYTIDAARIKFEIAPFMIRKLIKAGHIVASYDGVKNQGYQIPNTEEFRKTMDNVRAFLKLRGGIDYYDPAINYQATSVDGVLTKKHIAQFTGYSLVTIGQFVKAGKIRPDVQLSKSVFAFRKTPELFDRLEQIRAIKKSKVLTTNYLRALDAIAAEQKNSP